MNYQRLSQLADQLSARSASLFTVTPPSAQRPKWATLVLVALVLLAAVVRFWGVGSFSLHKPDEDTTALAAVHILEDGTPRFPNGMFYARAIAQSYMIAASAKVFGQTEWALRLPSVLCGVLVVVLAYWMGRRFLSPVWNLALAACVAFLPGLIADSQEARMYIFMIASLAAYAAFVFEWERSGKATMLAAAVVSMLVGVQFHQLVIFGSLIILFPGMLHGDVRKLWHGAIALATIGIGYLAISRWIGSFYPPAAAGYAVPVPQLGQAPSLSLRLHPLLSAVTVVGAIFVSWLTVRAMQWDKITRSLLALVLLGLLSQALLFYHVAFLFLLSAGVIASRHGRLSVQRLALLVGVTTAILIAHLYMLHIAGIASPRKIVGILVGRPSVWQYIRVAEYSWVACGITVVGFIQVLWQIANNKRIPDYWLFFLLAVWIPLFGLGTFGWYFPARYAEFALLPLVLVSLAICQGWVTSLLHRRPHELRPATAALAAVVSAAVVNPLAVARSVNSGATFADHRDAARFIQSVRLGPKDIVVAEEVLMQTYYLGHVDYWLQEPGYAAAFLVRKGNDFVDEYTATPVIGTADELQALLAQPGHRAVYVIGTGELPPRRGPEINELLQSDKFRVVYVAPDGRTTIWKNVTTGSPQGP